MAKRAILALGIVVLIGAAGWTGWVVTRPNDRVGVDQANCNATGDNYQALAAQPLITIPNRHAVTPNEFNEARRDRQAQKIELRAALRDYASACNLRHGAPP
jgi:hypothetical protein